MGTPTNGYISFGIVFSEYAEFPWDIEGYDRIEDWWVEDVCGYEPSFEIFDEDGEFIEGEVPDQHIIHEYCEELREFKRRNPLPFALMNCCSDCDPQYILAVPSSIIECSRGYPRELDLDKMMVSDKEVEDLIEFCKKYCVQEGVDFTPKWYLSSFWGD